MSNDDRRETLSELRRVISDYQDNYNQYNYNMHEYNKIITQYINLSSNMGYNSNSETYLRNARYNPYVRTPFVNTSRTMYPRPRQESTFSTRFENELFNYFLSSPTLANFVNRTDEELAGLTQSEINRKTRIIQYDSSMNETRCPISHADFEENEDVCQIIRCGHFFKKDSILRWFETNTQCPVCRYDLRENVTEYRSDISNNPLQGQTYTIDLPFYLNLPSNNT
jgi:hypothetical protein